MSLRYDISKIPHDVKVVTDDDGEEWLSPVTHSIIFSCMPIMMGTITEQNWEEFYTRVHAWERAFKPLMVKRNTETGEIVEREFLTPKMIHDHIGLHVNVITESKAKFKQHLWEQLLRDAEYELHRHHNPPEDVESNFQIEPEEPIIDLIREV
jgi:hypothetical protein